LDYLAGGHKYFGKVGAYLSMHMVSLHRGPIIHQRRCESLECRVFVNYLYALFGVDDNGN